MNCIHQQDYWEEECSQCDGSKNCRVSPPTRTEFFIPMKPPHGEWKSIPGYGKKYQINEMGAVRNIVSGKILKPIKKSDGYLVVNLSVNNKASQVMVHRLVAEAYIPNPLALPVVNHIDGDKANPDVKNLEWVTYSENSLHAFRTGLSRIGDKCKSAVSKIAVENGRKTTSKSISQYDSFGKLIKVYPSAHEAARATGVNRGNILQVSKGLRKQAGGFLWKEGSASEN